MTAATISREKIVSAPKRFLERKGYEVLSVVSNFDLVVYDKEENAVCFVNIEQVVDSWPDKPMITRSEFESSFASFFIDNLAQMNELGGDYGIRYDEIHVMVLSTERAILRHHQNALEIKEG